MNFIELEMAARDGIEPSTRGFSVRRRGRLGVNEAKNGDRFPVGRPKRPARPSRFRAQLIERRNERAPRGIRVKQLETVGPEPGPDMNVPGWGLHPLKGKLSNHWSVSVSGNWRLTFTFKDCDAELVDYQDYH